MAPKKEEQPDVEEGGGETEPLLESTEGKKKMNFEEIGLRIGWSGNYNPNKLSSFAAFSYVGGTVMMDRRIWTVCGTLAMIAFTVAGLCLVLMDAKQIRVDKLAMLVKYMKVFLAFLLGMFMNNSLARWWMTVNTLTDYFNNVEKLVYCANSFGFPADKRADVVRFSVVSCYCLATEVNSTWVHDKAELEKIWARALERLRKEGYLTADEVAQLYQIRPADRAGCTWSWIACVLCEMFEKLKPGQEAIKPQAMNRMVLQCQVAVDMVSQLKVQVLIQMPFMYVHMLSAMVHINNLLVALTCGLGLAGTIGTLMHSTASGKASGMLQSSQGLAMTLITLFVEPMLYQAFLQIGTNFCFPFGTEKHHIPVQWMIVDLVRNIDQMNYVTDQKVAAEAKGFQTDVDPVKFVPRKKFGGFWRLESGLPGVAAFRAAASSKSAGEQSATSS